MNVIAGITEEFVDEVSAELLSDRLDPENLTRKISSKLRADRALSARTLYALVRELNSKLFPPLAKIELILVEGCNLACQYCFESNVLNSKMSTRRVMDAETIKRSVELIFDYSGDRSRVNIVLFGGEPTLNMDGIATAVEHAKHLTKQTGKTVTYDMTSNGVLFNREMVDYLAENGIKVLLSIDGVEDVHDSYRVDRAGNGTFQRVMCGLNLLKTRQPWIGVKMTIMPSVADRLLESVRWLHKNGVNQFLVGHATGVVWSESNVAVYRQQMRALRRWYEKHKGSSLKISAFDKGPSVPGFFGCSAGRNSISVACNGDITGCSRISTLEGSRTVGSLGNVRYGLFNLKTRLEMNSCEALKRNCSEAGIAKEYAGGCFATNYEETGDLFRPNLVQHEFSVLLRDITSPSGAK